MASKYTNVEKLTKIVKERHDQGETYGEIATSLSLEKKQVQKLMERQRRKGSFSRTYNIRREIRKSPGLRKSAIPLHHIAAELQICNKFDWRHGLW